MILSQELEKNFKVIISYYGLKSFDNDEIVEIRSDKHQNYDDAVRDLIKRIKVNKEIFKYNNIFTRLLFKLLKKKREIELVNVSPMVINNHGAWNQARVIIKKIEV